MPRPLLAFIIAAYVAAGCLGARVILAHLRHHAYDRAAADSAIGILALATAYLIVWFLATLVDTLFIHDRPQPPQRAAPRRPRSQ